MKSLFSMRLGVGALALGLAGTAFAAPAQATSYDVAGVWLFNEGTGQKALDLSFSHNNGQLGSTPGADANDPSWVQLPRFLFLKRAALHFGGDDYVQVANSPSLEPDGVTLVARLRATHPGRLRYVVSKGALSCDAASYGLYTGEDSGLRFYISDGAGFVLSPDAGPGLWDGDWHTVVGAYDNGQVMLWVDGVKIGSTPSNLRIRYDLPDADGFYVGTYAGPCGALQVGFEGDVDGVAAIGSYVGRSASGLVG
jgi:hypothetical protein